MLLSRNINVYSKQKWAYFLNFYVKSLISISKLLVWFPRYVHQGGLQWFGHGGQVKLGVKVRKRMAIGVDDQVMLDRRHIGDEVVGGVDRMLRLDAVVTELADVSRQGGSKIC